MMAADAMACAAGKRQGSNDMRKWMFAVVFLALASPAFAQFGGLLDQGAKRAK